VPSSPFVQSSSSSFLEVEEASPRIFQCADHHDALYCDSWLRRLLHGLHEPVFRSSSRWSYTVHDVLTLDPFYKPIYDYLLLQHPSILSAVTLGYITVVEIRCKVRPSHKTKYIRALNVFKYGRL
jgi:hypothetical protein